MRNDRAARVIRLVASLSVLGCLVALAAPAHADDAEVIARVTKMNKKAIEEYENLNFEEARKLLREALDVCSANGLDKHPIKARTHIHLGIVIFAGFKQKELALKQFRKALDIQPDIRLTKSLANPEIQAAFDEALAGAGSEKAEPVADKDKDKKIAVAPPPPPPPTSGESKTVIHEPVVQGTQGNAITITATVDPSLGAEKVVLAYRPDGASEFLGREMKASGGGNYTADIPTSATSGNLVAYYIEAQGKDGQPIASKGSVADPIVVTLTGAGAPERPRLADEDDHGRPSRFYIGLQVGTGFGWMTGNGEVNVDDKVEPAGFAMAQLGHLAPELGFFIKPSLMISVQGRFQLVTGATPLKLPMKGSTPEQTAELMAACGGDYLCSPANGAIAVLARLTYFFGGESSVRPFAGFSAGGGYIRHVAPFKKQAVCGTSGNQTCVDTVAAGPVLFGPDAGILYAFSRHVGLVLGVNTQIGVSHFTFNIDVNAGLAVQL